MDNVYMKLVKRGKELMDKYDDDVRHPIVVDHNDDIAAIAASIDFSVRNIPSGQGANTARVLAEILYVMGYQDGQQDTKPVDDVWKE